VQLLESKPAGKEDVEHTRTEPCIVDDEGCAVLVDDANPGVEGIKVVPCTVDDDIAAGIEDIC